MEGRLGVARDGHVHGMERGLELMDLVSEWVMKET